MTTEKLSLSQIRARAEKHGCTIAWHNGWYYAALAEDGVSHHQQQGQYDSAEEALEALENDDE